MYTEATRRCYSCGGNKQYNLVDCLKCRLKDKHRAFDCIVCGGRTAMGRLAHDGCLKRMKKKTYCNICHKIVTRGFMNHDKCERELARELAELKMQAKKKELGITDSEV